MCALQARMADSKFSMSVDSEQQVVKLGTSTDLGFCRSRKKVGLRQTLFTIPAACMLKTEFFASNTTRPPHVVQYELELLLTRYSFHVQFI